MIFLIVIANQGDTMVVSVRRKCLLLYILFTMTIAGFGGLFYANGIIEENFGSFSNTIIVDCNGGGQYTTIKAAVNAASNGDTIRVWAGTYNENVIVKKSLDFIGNGSSETVIDAGAYANVIWVEADSINITGFTLTNSGRTDKNWHGSGLRLENLNYGRISNNNISLNYYNLNIINSQNLIVENNIFNSAEWGIELGYSSYLSIVNNTCINNKIRDSPSK